MKRVNLQATEKSRELIKTWAAKNGCKMYDAGEKLIERLNYLEAASAHLGDQIIELQSKLK